jgi:hypothetical protein
MITLGESRGADEKSFDCPNVLHHGRKFSEYQYVRRTLTSIFALNDINETPPGAATLRGGEPTAMPETSDIPVTTAQLTASLAGLTVGPYADASTAGAADQAHLRQLRALGVEVTITPAAA